MVTPVTVQEKEFPSRAAAARHFGVTQATMNTRLAKGWTLEQALELAPPNKSNHKSYNLWLRRTGKHERVCSKCGEQKSLDEFYKRPEKQSGDYYSYCILCTRRQVLESHRRREYGLNPDQWNQLFELQGSKCMICGTTDPQGTWHTDHCHETNEVRGILCKNCNLLLGLAKDNITTLENAVLYLKGLHRVDSLMIDEYVDLEEIS